MPIHKSQQHRWASESANGSNQFLNYIKSELEEIELDYQNMVSSIFSVTRNLASGGISAAGGVTAEIISGVGAVFSFISFLIFVGIINFYLILDWEKLGPMVRTMVPVQHREKTFKTMKKVDIAVGGFLRGQLTVSIVVGSLFAIGLFIMGFLVSLL